uniref:Uncharacterized protein n=1 Tax=Timema cristinae TaxID=61476 RepID=A0A7R9D503_TIMCR|nr:unnamed protein product [Timema cristinae]
MIPGTTLAEDYNSDDEEIEKPTYVKSEQDRHWAENEKALKRISNFPRHWRKKRDMLEQEQKRKWSISCSIENLVATPVERPR